MLPLLGYFNLVLKKGFPGPPNPGDHYGAVGRWVYRGPSRNIVSQVKYRGPWNTIIFLNFNSPFRLMPSKMTLVLEQPDHTVGSKETWGPPKPTALFHTSSCQLNPFLSLLYTSDVLFWNWVLNSDFRFDSYPCFIIGASSYSSHRLSLPHIQEQSHPLWTAVLCDSILLPLFYTWGNRDSVR